MKDQQPFFYFLLLYKEICTIFAKFWRFQFWTEIYILSIPDAVETETDLEIRDKIIETAVSTGVTSRLAKFSN